MADEGMKFIKNIGPVRGEGEGERGLSEQLFPLQMLRDLYTFLEKAVPDTKLTLKKYSDAKFEFLVCIILLCIT